MPSPPSQFGFPSPAEVWAWNGVPLQDPNDYSCVEQLRKCSRCKESKSLEAFSRRGENGYQYWCRACRAASYVTSRETDPQLHRRWTLWARYRLTLEGYAAMLESQGGGCAICGAPPPEDSSLCVDHDHGCCPKRNKSCGKCVRSLLCDRCNRLVGKVESPLGQQAVSYVDKWRGPGA